MAATAARHASLLGSSRILSDTYASTSSRLRDFERVSPHSKGCRRKNVCEDGLLSSLWGQHLEVLTAAQRIVHWHRERGSAAVSHLVARGSQQTQSPLSGARSVGSEGPFCQGKRGDLLRCNAQAQEVKRIPARTPDEKCEKVSLRTRGLMMQLNRRRCQSLTKD